MILKITLEKEEFIEKSFKKAIKDLGNFYGFKWTENIPQLVIVPDRKTIDFLMMKKTEKWMVGWVNARKIYVLSRENYEKESDHKYSDKEYELLIKHELSHLFFEVLAGRKYDIRWFCEGVAIYTAGQNETKTRPKKFEGFLSPKKETKYIYGESGFVVELLVKKYGKEKLLTLIKGLKDLKADNDFDKLFKKIYKFDLKYQNLNRIYAE